LISPVTNRVPFNEIISSFDDYYDQKEDIEQKKKIPHIPGNLIYNPNFVLILNDFVYSFQEISGIDIDFPNDHNMTEGGNSRHLFARKTLMEEDTTNLILKRAMPIRRSQIKAQNISALLSLVTPSGIGFLRKQSLLAAAKLDPVYTLEHGPAEGIIQIFDRTFKNDVANFRFFSYGAHKWTLGELDATSGNIVYETIELICTNFTRVLPSDIKVRDDNTWINFVNKAVSQEFDDLEAARNKRLQDLKDLETDNVKRKEKWKKDQEQLKKEQEDEEDGQEKRINEFLTKIREQQKAIQEQLKKDLEKGKKERLEKLKDRDEIDEQQKAMQEQLKKDLEKEKAERLEKMEALDKENAKRKEEWEKIHEQLKKE
jgi:hypothetical protein